MARRGMRVNRFDVQVVFRDVALGIKNRADVELTAAQVVAQLEKFCARIREGLQRSQREDATTDSGNMNYPPG